MSNSDAAILPLTLRHGCAKEHSAKNDAGRMTVGRTSPARLY
jgi:hypothetical protein